MRKLLITFCLLVSTWIMAQDKVQLSDSSHISLLTNTPSTEIYAMYGHTAIRVADAANNLDLVFNYGMFNSFEENFIWQFVRGKTDYVLGVYDTQYLFPEANMRNFSINEQVLNLTLAQRQRLFDALVINAQPENKTYRYNFLFDNCSTRPWKMIEKALEVPIRVADTTATGGTFREIIHRCTANYPWVTLGIDVALGSRIDQPVSYSEQLFLPAYLEEHLRRVTLAVDSVNYQPLVQKEYFLVEAGPEDESERPSPWMGPMPIIGVLSLILLVVSFIEAKSRRLFRGIDLFLMLVMGLVGIVVHFLLFFSAHPAVSPNWMGIFFHPMMIVFAILLIGRNKLVLSAIAVLNMGSSLALALIALFGVQAIPAPVILLTLVLFVRGIVILRHTTKPNQGRRARVLSLGRQSHLSYTE